MTIAEFYERLTEIMQKYESQTDSLEEAKGNLRELLAEAKGAQLKHVNVSMDVFDDIEQKERDSYGRGSSYC